jgi:hypothetical protein
MHGTSNPKLLHVLGLTDVSSGSAQWHVIIVKTIESSIYPNDAQIYCSKNIKIYIKINLIGAPTCFGFSRPSSSGSYYVYMFFAKVISTNNQLKCVVYRIFSV